MIYSHVPSAGFEESDAAFSGCGSNLVMLPYEASTTICLGAPAVGSYLCFKTTCCEAKLRGGCHDGQLICLFSVSTVLSVWVHLQVVGPQ